MARAADDQRIEADLVAPALKALSGRRTAGSVRGGVANITHLDIEREYERDERLRLTESRFARDAVLRVLDESFARRHYEDGEPEGYERRDYLRRELNGLDDGDVVITTNWDTMIERTLLEDGRWSPADGYGFNARLTPIPPEVRQALASGLEWPSAPAGWPEWVPDRSAVRVLKIHGSFGWRTQMRYGARVEAPGRVYLESARFLSAMPLVRPRVRKEAAGSGDVCMLWDEAEPDFYDSSDQPLFVYPSYLKQLSGTTLQQVWSEANLALHAATEIRALGASLPDADGPVRALLNPVRRRVEDGTVRMTVDDPSRTTLDRWRVFLGDRVVRRRRMAGERS